MFNDAPGHKLSAANQSVSGHLILREQGLVRCSRGALDVDHGYEDGPCGPASVRLPGRRRSQVADIGNAQQLEH